MKFRPILFKGEMVRAILSGQKTQTRRIVKWPKEVSIYGGSQSPANPDDCQVLNGTPIYICGEGESQAVTCPYGVVSDQLWVRENFQPFLNADCDGDMRVANWKTGENYHCTYPATDGVHEFLDYDDNLRSAIKPSIHMPRWASRITLEVTNVRVERLQDISEEDAKAEGCEMAEETTADDERLKIECGYFPPSSYAHGYRLLWESINGAGTWDANPWVWVVEFKRIDCIKEHLHG